MKKIGFVFKKVATVPFSLRFVCLFVPLVNSLPPKVLHGTMGNPQNIFGTAWISLKFIPHQALKKKGKKKGKLAASCATKCKK